jgi:CubicO group peptidase (beta-lactamase class C family)
MHSKNLHRREFLQQTGLLSLGMGLLPGISELSWLTGNASSAFQKISPEQAGISSAAILKFLTEADKSGLELHSFMLLRHGKLVTEAYWKPFDKEYVHTLYSLSKSFTSTAVGLAVKEGKFKVTDKVISFFPEHLPATVSDNLAKMEIQHLLTMSTGHRVDTIPVMREKSPASWMRSFLSVPVEYEPGTHFLYNTGATYMLGAVVYKTTHQTLAEYLAPRLFKPLGITKADWEKSPEGLNLGGYGLRVTTQDIARFGQMYLQKGKWNNKEILPEAWVDTATTSHIKSGDSGNDWSQGYGYQFWRCKPGFYRGDGAYGQFCIVMPQYDAVVAITGESKNMQGDMDMVWNLILPELKEQPLAENAADNKSLDAFITSLTLPAQQGNKTSANQQKINGKVIQLKKNRWGLNSMTVFFTSRGGKWVISGDNGDTVIPFSWNKWESTDNGIKNPFTVDYRTAVASKVASSAGWENDSALKIRLKYVEGIHGDLITLNISGNEVAISFLNSLAEKNPTANKDERETLSGTI